MMTEGASSKRAVPWLGCALVGGLAVAALGAALVAVSLGSGKSFEAACSAVPRGVTWQVAGDRLEEAGGEVSGWGGDVGKPPTQRDWGRDAFPIQRQRCTVNLDEDEKVTGTVYESWSKYGPSEYEQMRLRRILKP